MVSSEQFTRHFDDVKSQREVGYESHEWRPRHVSDIITLSKGYRHSFMERADSDNKPKKFKGPDQESMEFRFNHILTQYSKYSILVLCHLFQVGYMLIMSHRLRFSPFSGNRLLFRFSRMIHFR